MAAVNLGKWSSTDDVIRELAAHAGTDRGQTVIVTGCNTGIGKETARALASLGFRVLMACRSLVKANAAAADIMADFPDCLVSCLPLDLSSSESIKSFHRLYIQQKLEKSWPPLRILVLNAGVFPLGGRSISQDGFENTFATNHLGNFLLTKLLLPELRENGPSRIIVVASDSHRGPLLSANMLDQADVLSKVAHCDAINYSLVGAYGTSKLCNVLFASLLHAKERQMGTSVVACSLHPGSMIGTDIARDSWIGNLLFKYVVSWFTKSINQGASTTILSCLRPHDELQGKYFSDCAECATSALAADVNAQEILWDLSEKLCIE